MYMYINPKYKVIINDYMSIYLFLHLWIQTWIYKYKLWMYHTCVYIFVHIYMYFCKFKIYINIFRFVSIYFNLHVYIPHLHLF